MYVLMDLLTGKPITPLTISPAERDVNQMAKEQLLMFKGFGFLSAFPRNVGELLCHNIFHRLYDSSACIWCVSEINRPPGNFLLTS